MLVRGMGFYLIKAFVHHSLWMKIFQHDPCILEFSLDHLKDCDFLPLFELFMDIDDSLIREVDIHNKTLCVMNGGYVLALLRALNKKLRAVHLNDLSLEKGFLRDLSKRGLTCKELNLRSSHLRQLNVTGSFIQLQTLNLDFNTSLTSLQENCFSCMPILKHLSVCATRVSNLWTTAAALSKLPSLIELRFQNCLCCNNTGHCPKSSAQRAQDNNWSGYYVRASSRHSLLINQPYSHSEEMFLDTSVIEDASLTENAHWPREDISEDYEVDAPNGYQELSFPEFLSNALNNFDLLNNNVPVHPWILSTEDGDFSARSFYSSQAQSLDDSGKKKYLTHHPSPICFEKHYRDYIIASLPQLQVLDNLPVNDTDKESAKFSFSKCFEYLPYRRRKKESIVSILNKRETNSSGTYLCKNKRSSLYVKSPQYHCRSLGAAKVGASAWPLLHPLSTSGYVFGDENKSFRPRQFEYNPSDSGLMAFGTLDGEVVVVNHENAKIFSYIPCLGAMNSVLGLCWLKRYPSKLIAGSDNGSLRLYDVQHWQAAVTGRNCNASGFAFDDFDQLTSVHVNATDELFIASGYSKNVALYDINTGKRLNMFSDMHQQHINVVKFSNHSPSVFATSSFDQDVKMWDLRQGPFQPCFKATSSHGNVMVCFSPDDLYLLVSAVDNEVKQLSAIDGRLLLDFEISSTGSSQNYTRSYYMNGRDYIISGSCDENIVRICCAQTGRRLRDISLEGRGSGASMFVQSLRGDPFRDFNMSILAAYMRPSSKSEIIKVNLLASNDSSSDPSEDETYLPSFGMGG
ncbi:hypothetical protein SOVF_095500 isoform B [Spinacia oleracea]|uniref:Uncharacterized protein LOC110794125 isoform X2 n=1 Tax=Spinacia oleracea TaxID=3562 RepID=A0A9R0ISG5_SPIOL|nr:protein DWD HYPERSENSITIVE TO UV-B 1 isoform X2 [Spinacia oleracea]XP_021854766.1 protein DWD HYPERSENSITIVE TO UV-B 1 isoform X2 [Spinacia oleracea]KNA15740.1 hypothetical protein SOVF_095500 isoform B [Spinacia oleracea]